MPSRLAACALLILAAAALAPVAAPPAFATLTAEEPPTATVLPANDTEKAEILNAVRAADVGKSDDGMAAALTRMITRKHSDFAPIIKKQLDAAEPSVLAAAVRAAASAEMKDEEKRIRKLLKTKPKAKDAASGGAVPAACVDYLVRLGFAGEDETIRTDLFTPFFGDQKRMEASWAQDFVGSSLLYFGKFKCKKAVMFIVSDVLPKPEPKNPNDPKNPGQSYWDARGKLWTNGGESWSRWALKEITGQEFRTVREWTEWVAKNKKDLEK